MAHILPGTLSASACLSDAAKPPMAGQQPGDAILSAWPSLPAGAARGLTEPFKATSCTGRSRLRLGHPPRAAHLPSSSTPPELLPHPKPPLLRTTPGPASQAMARERPCGQATCLGGAWGRLLPERRSADSHDSAARDSTVLRRPPGAGGAPGGGAAGEGVLGPSAPPPPAPPHQCACNQLVHCVLYSLSARGSAFALLAAQQRPLCTWHWLGTWQGLGAGGSSTSRSAAKQRALQGLAEMATNGALHALDPQLLDTVIRVVPLGQTRSWASLARLTAPPARPPTRLPALPLPRPPTERRLWPLAVQRSVS